MKMRLDRWLTTLNVDSRSRVKEIIRNGQVKVDGKTVTDPAFSCETETQHLMLQGRETDGRVMRHVLLNKPAGLLTAARDPKQPTVMDLLPDVYSGIGCMPVGRLDKDTTGVLLLTCDGELNHRLLSPGRHVDKVYRATVEGRLEEKDVRAFAAGLELSDFTALPAVMTILRADDSLSEAEVTVREGKFHQIKRMFSAVGHEVTELHRLSFGPLTLENGPEEGKWRELTEDETDMLYEAAGMRIK
ncbi:MAG: pseudouridine synthase [Clostridia bacterium]|nr:pseudouridine synthase [Clostridia bacterium]